MNTAGAAAAGSSRSAPGRRRMLVMCSPFPTHLMPLIALCWAWRGAGHDVLVVGQPDIMPVVERAGLTAALIGPAFDELRRRGDRAPARPPVRDQRPATPPWDKLGVVWRQRCETLLEPALALAEQWQPDVILADPLEFTSLAVGGLLGVPVIQQLWGMDAWSLQVQAPARQQLAGFCHQLGLVDGLPVADVVLDPRPRSLLPAEPGTPIRSVPFNGVGVVPDWVTRARRDARVCISLGTRHIALNGVSLLRSMALAAAALPNVEVLLPIAATDRAELGELPPQVRVVDPCPLQLFLPTCQVLMHHGAAGSGMSAVVAGVPQLVLPWASFDTFHADATVASSSGLSLFADEQDSSTVSSALNRLLSEPAFAAGARRLAAEAAAMPAPSAVVRDLLDLL